MAETYLRAGRSVGRTLYECSADDQDGQLVGMVDTPELAAEIVAAVNRRRMMTAAFRHAGETGGITGASIAGRLFPKLVGRAMQAEAEAERARKLGESSG
jgi:hypothetical protein